MPATSPTTMPPKTFQTLLNDLPPELYNDIKDLVFAAGPNLAVSIDATYKPPSILHVCKETRAIAAKSYYSLTTFAASSADSIKWIENLSHEHVAHIRCLHLDGPATVQSNDQDTTMADRDHASDLATMIATLPTHHTTTAFPPGTPAYFPSQQTTITIPATNPGTWYNNINSNIGQLGSASYVLPPQAKLDPAAEAVDINNHTRFEKRYDLLCYLQLHEIPLDRAAANMWVVNAASKAISWTADFTPTRLRTILHVATADMQLQAMRMAAEIQRSLNENLTNRQTSVRETVQAMSDEFAARGFTVSHVQGGAANAGGQADGDGADMDVD